MSLKLKVVLGDSHKPTRAIPGLIYLFSAEAELQCSHSKEMDLQKKTKKKSVQFPEVKVIFSQLLSIRQCWEWFRTV